MFFGQFHLIFPYKEILSLFGHFHVTFPYMETLSIFGRYAQKLNVSCFSDSIIQNTTQQSDGSCNVISDSQLLFKVFTKQSFQFSKHEEYENEFGSKEWCVARNDDKMCFLPNWRYHIILIGDFKDERVATKIGCILFQLATRGLCTHFSSTDSMANLLSRAGKSLRLCRGQFIPNIKTEQWTECPASRKKDSWGKKYKQQSLSSFQKTTSMQTIGSVFADRIEQFEKTKTKSKLIKPVDCILDGLGKNSIFLLSFIIKKL